uniref:Uncharacterized protein n=1 Tax=Mustela putorius furo TaxID=9669 RepID=M3Y9E4_MUSPF
TRPLANGQALPGLASGEPGLAHCDARTSPPTALGSSSLQPRGARQRPRPRPAPPPAPRSAGAETATPPSPPTAAPAPRLPRGAPRGAPEPELTQGSPPRFARARLAWTGSGPLSLHGRRRDGARPRSGTSAPGGRRRHHQGCHAETFCPSWGGRDKTSSSRVCQGPAPVQDERVSGALHQGIISPHGDNGFSQHWCHQGCPEGPGALAEHTGPRRLPGGHPEVRKPGGGGDGQCQREELPVPPKQPP